MIQVPHFVLLVCLLAIIAAIFVLELARKHLNQHKHSAAAWEQLAQQAERNTQYYRGLVVQIGEMFGREALTSDDGSVQDSVLCAKVPELVAARLGVTR